ncbi:MAG: PHP domain-containing protein [Candidatus Hydrothermarchaeales archaeon]
MKLDLHIHTKYSKDSNSDTKEVIKVSKKRGLDGIAVTEHNTIRGGVEAQKHNEDPDFTVIVGSEVHTEKGEVIGYFLNEEIKSRSVYEVIDEMREQDAVIVIPHPYDIFRFSSLKPEDDILKRVDCIEAFNARCTFSRFNKKAKELAENSGLGITAGSDAHTLSEIGAGGVVLSGKVGLREEILKNRETFGKASPFYVHVYSTMTKILK